MPTVTEMWG